MEGPSTVPVGRKHDRRADAETTERAKKKKHRTEGIQPKAKGDTKELVRNQRQEGASIERFIRDEPRREQRGQQGRKQGRDKRRHDRVEKVQGVFEMGKNPESGRRKKGGKKKGLPKAHCRRKEKKKKKGAVGGGKANKPKERK